MPSAWLCTSFPFFFFVFVCPPLTHAYLCTPLPHLCSEFILIFPTLSLPLLTRTSHFSHCSHCCTHRSMQYAVCGMQLGGVAVLLQKHRHGLVQCLLALFHCLLRDAKGLLIPVHVGEGILVLLLHLPPHRVDGHLQKGLAERAVRDHIGGEVFQLAQCQSGLSRLRFALVDQSGRFCYSRAVFVVLHRGFFHRCFGLHLLPLPLLLFYLLLTLQPGHFE
mmetsp:Transcript_6955/g.17668  ORF Transcript_6955/g.17668 Transcript_6955/m.17668 type:complete len:220 (+) Transcript_6955:1836-2495(+)